MTEKVTDVPSRGARRVRALLALAAAVLLAGCVASNEASQPASAAEYNLQLGISYLRQNNLQAARAKLEKAVEQDPGLATAHAALGVVYEKLEDLDGAERQYRRAVSLAPDDPDTLNALAVFLCGKRQKTEDALRNFDKAIAIPLSVKDANRAMLNTNAGTCARRSDPARAEQYLRRALAEDPRFPDALLQLGEVSLDQGNPLQARAFVQRYLAAHQPSPGALWLGVRVERSLGDTAAADRYAEQLQRQFPEAGETRLLLARPGRS
jgi:type IV pilus assembly protein PilF